MCALFSAALRRKRVGSLSIFPHHVLASAGTRRWINPTRAPPTPEYSPRHAHKRFASSLSPVQGYPAWYRLPSLFTRGTVRATVRGHAPAASRLAGELRVAALRSPSPPSARPIYIWRDIPTSTITPFPSGRNFYVQRGLRADIQRSPVSPPPPPTLFFPSRRGRLPPPAKLRAALI